MFRVSQGVKAVLAVSFDRVHRANLVSMGVLPLQYLPGQSARQLGLTGRETFTISLPRPLSPRPTATVKVSHTAWMSAAAGTSLEYWC